MKWVVYLLVVVMFILHQDYWNFSSDHLYFGFLPIGLAYHVVYSIACCILMALLVIFAWPAQLEKYETAVTPTSGNASERHSNPDGH